MKKLIANGILLFVFVCPLFATDQEDVLTIVNAILKRKDVDLIKETIAPGASFLMDDNMSQMVDVVQQRDKERALGQGSYEDTVSTTITINPPMALVVCETNWYGKIGKQGWTKTKMVNARQHRVNTIVLEKIKGKWKVLHWHMSGGATKEE